MCFICACRLHAARSGQALSSGLRHEHLRALVVGRPSSIAVERCVPEARAQKKLLSSVPA